MIVYGDPQFHASTSEVLRWLRRSLETVNAADLDSLRSTLIKAGQAEQAIADAAAGSGASGARIVARLQTVPDLLAKAFVAHLDGPGYTSQTERLESARWVGEARVELERIAADVAPLERLQSDALTLKSPEGFEFYALFPEQYRMSARLWAADHAAHLPKHVRVIGVRGIGTTLSAVVCAALEASGWTAARLTARPTGHPFDRRSTLEAADIRDAEFALIVDEGPGLSGSSMVAVASALVGLGFDRRRISFLPGHGGDPGPSASAESRRWWADTPRYFTPLDRARWRPRSSGMATLNLGSCLAEATARIRGLNQPVAEARNAGGGLWRAFAYDSEADWPAVTARFESPKYLCACPDGTQVLWKFAGLGAWAGNEATAAELALARSCSLADGNWAPQPLGFSHGFIAIPWVEGRRLTPADANDAKVLRRVADYLTRSGGPALSPGEQARSVDRLREMARCNILEAFNDCKCVEVFDALPWSKDGAAASYGDGRMAPHEWVRMRAGELVKTDVFGHAADHTVVGRQSALWDVAGVIVEWDLRPKAREKLLAWLSLFPLGAELRALRFYEIAYAAFRLGQTTLCLSLEPVESKESARLAAARYRYARALRDFLEEAAEAVGATSE